MQQEKKWLFFLEKKYRRIVKYFQFIEDLSNNYGIQKYNNYYLSLVCRLRISFKWLVRAFSGYLATDQLLLLWDRILGYNSLEILAGNRIIFTKCFKSRWM